MPQSRLLLKENVNAANERMKRRRNHTQVIRPTLAAELKTWFANKMPHTPALRMPRRPAEVFREDLKDARGAWIEDVKDNAKEQQQRQRSDFLAVVNHQQEKAVFYSLRHGHGTALAAAGVAEKDIAMSMHHASRTTTTRYLHGDRKVIASALAGMPDFSPQKQVATGTHPGAVNAVATFPEWSAKSSNRWTK
jgi:integrase